MSRTFSKKVKSLPARLRLNTAKTQSLFPDMGMISETAWLFLDCHARLPDVMSYRLVRSSEAHFNIV